MAGSRAPSPGGLPEIPLGGANDAVHVAECEHQAGVIANRLSPVSPFGFAVLLADGKSVQESFYLQCLINSEIYAFIEQSLLFLSVPSL